MTEPSHHVPCIEHAHSSRMCHGSAVVCIVHRPRTPLPPQAFWDLDFVRSWLPVEGSAYLRLRRQLPPHGRTDRGILYTLYFIPHGRTDHD